MKNKIEYKRIIGAKTLSYIFRWIDSAYAVNNNMRGNTGGCNINGV